MTASAGRKVILAALSLYIINCIPPSDVRDGRATFTLAVAATTRLIIPLARPYQIALSTRRALNVFFEEMLLGGLVQ